MTMISRADAGRAPLPQMNVTPLVDVVLVLLIIFIVVTPQLNQKFWVHVPKQERRQVEHRTVDEAQQPLVLRLEEDHSLTINAVTVTIDEIPERLRRMFAARDDHVLFFDASDEAEYGFAVAVMDQARAGGAVTIATLMTEAVKQE